MRDEERQNLKESIESLIGIELIKAMKAGRYDAAEILVDRIIKNLQKNCLSKDDKSVIQTVFRNLIESDQVLRLMNPEAAKTRKSRGFLETKGAYFVVKKYHDEGKPLTDSGAFLSAAEHLGISEAGAKRRYYEYQKDRNEWLSPLTEVS